MTPGADDELAPASVLFTMVHSGRVDFLSLPTLKADARILRQHDGADRPPGSKDFITGLEARLGRRPGPQKGGRPRKER